jgi:hypothetical protein
MIHSMPRRIHVDFYHPSCIQILHQSLTATSHTRPRTHDHYTSSTLIGGKRGSRSKFTLHTTLKGPTEYLNARRMVKVYMDSYMPSNGSCFMVTCMDYFSKPPLGGRANTKPPWHSEHSQLLIYSMLSCVRTARI